MNLRIRFPISFVLYLSCLGFELYQPKKIGYLISFCLIEILSDALRVFTAQAFHILVLFILASLLFRCYHKLNCFLISFCGSSLHRNTNVICVAIWYLGRLLDSLRLSGDFEKSLVLSVKNTTSSFLLPLRVCFLGFQQSELILLKTVELPGFSLSVITPGNRLAFS